MNFDDFFLNPVEMLRSHSWFVKEIVKLKTLTFPKSNIPGVYPESISFIVNNDCKQEQAIFYP